MNNGVDFLAIGDITTDAFIRIKEANVHCNLDRKNCEICMKFADKIPFEFAEIVKAVGNSPNAAVSAAKLGLGSALVSNVGDDQNGKECLGVLRENGVSVDFVKVNAGKNTNYHYVLWYEDERTILVKHEAYEYALPTIPPPQWIYLSSIGDSSDYHTQIEKYLTENPDVKLTFQPGTYQMRLGVEKLAGIYKRSEVFVCNVEESQRILKTQEKDLVTLLKGIHSLGPKIVSITDGPQGAYAYDGTTAWFMPIYPDPKPPLERTGCGDAFASTLTAALMLGKTLEEALLWAPINPMSVVQHVGAQKGLLSRPELEALLAKAPMDYKPQKIN